MRQGRLGIAATLVFAALMAVAPTDPAVGLDAPPLLALPNGPSVPETPTLPLDPLPDASQQIKPVLLDSSLPDASPLPATPTLPGTSPASNPAPPTTGRDASGPLQLGGAPRLSVVGSGATVRDHEGRASTPPSGLQGGRGASRAVGERPPSLRSSRSGRVRAVPAAPPGFGAAAELTRPARAVFPPTSAFDDPSPELGLAAQLLALVALLALACFLAWTIVDEQREGELPR